MEGCGPRLAIMFTVALYHLTLLLLMVVMTTRRPSVLFPLTKTENGPKTETKRKRKNKKNGNLKT